MRRAGFPDALRTRRLLLFGVAALSTAWHTIAAAQVPATQVPATQAPTTTQLPTPQSPTPQSPTTQLPAARVPAGAATQGQIVNTPLPFGAAGANDNNNYQATMTPPGTAVAPGGQIAVSGGFIANPTPGSIVIHLGGRVDVEVQANFTSLDKGVTAAGPTGVIASGNKVQPVGIGQFMRLYPGVDGMAASGLRYGASVEIRQNFASANNQAVSLTSSTAGNTIGAAAASPSGNSSAQTLFVRRAFTYLAGDRWGLLRLGQTDGVLGLFDNCVFTAQCWDFGSGGIDAGASQQIFPSNASPPFVWLSQTGAEYANSKLVYLSPQFFGFDFGVQYAPSMGNGFSDSAGASPLQAAPCASAATGGCVLQSSGALDGSRWLNQVAVGARYQGAFRGFEPKFYVLYETAGKTDFTGPQPAISAASPANARRFDNLSFISTGLALSYAGVTASLDYIAGAVNNQLAMKPQGGAPMSAPLFGLRYTAGPLTLGAALGIANYQGTNQLVHISQRHTVATALGGYYVLAPGMAIVAEYLYDQIHQGDVNLATGATGTRAFNDVKAQGFTLGSVVNW